MRYRPGRCAETIFDVSYAGEPRRIGCKACVIDDLIFGTLHSTLPADVRNPRRGSRHRSLAVLSKLAEENIRLDTVIFDLVCELFQIAGSPRTSTIGRIPDYV